MYGGLPLIETENTVIDRFCPAKVKKARCKVERYRRIDGQCNNPDNPLWGATSAPFRRVLPADYADGKSGVRLRSVNN